jgi:hypothetical protein
MQAAARQAAADSTVTAASVGAAEGVIASS